MTPQSPALAASERRENGDDGAAAAAAKREPFARDRYVGIRSGELFVRMRGAPDDASSLLHGLSPGLRELVVTRPSLRERMAARDAAVQDLRARRERLRLRREAFRARIDGLHSAVDAAAASAMPTASSSEAVRRFDEAWHGMVDVWTQCTRSGVMALYALLETEREVIEQWRRREQETCDALVRTTKRRFQFASFALHLESETLGQIRLWRLPETDAQRVRCVKAATENVKPLLLPRGGRLEVSDVYKIENRPLLQSLERFTRRLGGRDATKIKGLFCSVPLESLEHCVVWGMHVDGRHAADTRRRDSAFVATSDDAAAEEECATRVFNRPRIAMTATATAVPSSTRVAEQRVLDAERMAFPRRFSRFSTLSDAQYDAPNAVTTQYLALCRVAMGKTLRLPTSAGAAGFPEDASVASLYIVEQDEYVVRYAEAVVPEFLVEYQVVVGGTQETRQSPLQSEILVPVDVARPVVPPELLPSTAFLSTSDRMIAMCRADDSVLARPPPAQDPPHVAPPASTSAARVMATETALANSATQRRALMEDVEGMTQTLWSQSKRLWDALHRQRIESSSAEVLDRRPRQSPPAPERRERVRPPQAAQKLRLAPTTKAPLLARKKSKPPAPRPFR